jgi:RAQPRD family integrative conjugative element protein
MTIPNKTIVTATGHLLCFLICFPFWSSAQASTVTTPVARETELAALARLEHEIELLKVTIREAETSTRGTRLRFDYDALRLDLDKIKLGIREHRLGELDTPRVIEPLSGDYR